ncbi:MAG: hypothetical protein OSB19_03400 [Opitutaceae bacterium]|nr:hypothetical protein [Opitutaceae bacterium]
MTRSQLLPFFAVLFFGTTALLAHRLPEGLTTIELNENTGQIEIVHHLHAHDVEVVLSEILKDPQWSLDTLEARAQLSLYIEKHFHIVDRSNGKPVTLKLIGAEMDNDEILVFQEAEAPLPSTLSMRHDALREIIPEQVNTVNILLGSQTRTLVFAKKDTWKDL